MKPLVVHVLLLGLASAAALKIWTRDVEKDKAASAEVEIWSGAPESVELVSYESKQRKLKVEPKKDGTGRYFVMRLEKDEVPPAPPPPHPPHDGEPPPPPPPPAQPVHEKSSFVGVKAAQETIDKLAHLTAVRALGKLDPKQAAEFGLDKPEGTLKLKLGGKEHVLTIGGSTPGSSERYAKYGASGEVFAISSDLTQGLQFADSRLMERDFHAFDAEEPTRIKLSKGPKSRELVRIAGKKDAWADAATPTKADETVVNWLNKLSRVRVTDYVETPATPPSPASLSVRLEYFAGSKNLGFLELYKVTGGPSGEYLARSEQTRWYVKVLGSAAEQADQDTQTLFK